MPSARPSRPLPGLLCLLVLALLVGCAPAAPPTITPARPTTLEHGPTAEGPGEAGPTDEPSADPTGEPTGDPTGEAAPPEEPLDGDDGPGNAETRQGRGQKESVDYADLIALGEELTAALDSGDVERWLALTALRGDEAQQQRDWFAGVQAVPMDVREMHPTWLLERDVEGDVDGPLVEFAFRHQITGADVVPAVQLYELILERVGTDGPYRVVSVSGSEAGDTAYPQLWDLRAIEVIETEHTVLLAEQGSEVAELTEAMDVAAGEVLDTFPVEGVDRMAVSVVDESLVARLFGESEEGTYAGFAVPVPASPEVLEGRNLPDVVTDDSIGSRIVVDLDYVEEEWAFYDAPEGGAPLLRHEGLHLAMMLLNPDNEPPAWAVEGFAGWFEIVGDESLRQSHEEFYAILAGVDGLPESLPPRDYFDFFVDDDDTVERNYLEAANLFVYAEEAHGAEAATDLGVALHEINIWIDGDEAVDRVLQEQLGVDLAAFEAGYLAWVQATFDS